ncbi:MAG TPA: DUF721 domain-containing protein [Coriobacteriia bacterium]|nr:DUF721 domain-containing protein [Coriobacteriia bacterium]
MKRKGSHAKLSAGLDKLATKLNKKNEGALDQARVALAWEKIAGPTVLSHTTGAHVRRGELVIYVDSPLWATELSALSEKYREAVEEEIGKGAVRSVRFAVSRKVEMHRELMRVEEQTTSHYMRDNVDSIPLTEEERSQVDASAAEIPDAELREAVIRATVADLEWKKGIRAAKGREGAREGS